MIAAPKPPNILRARGGSTGVPSWIDRCGRHSRCRGIDRTGLRFGEAAFPKRLEPYGLLWIDQALNRGRGRSFAFTITSDHGANRLSRLSDVTQPQACIEVFGDARSQIFRWRIGGRRVSQAE
jgi:hypothetical protein